MKYFLRYSIVAFVLLLASCGDYNKVLKSTDYEYKYEMAKQFYAEGSYARAAYILQDIVAIMKGTDRGEESLYLLGMSQYKSGSYDAAATVFRKYYQTYPNGVYAEEAHYYCGRALYADTPEPKLDQTSTYAAINEFQNFLDTYPDTPLREQSQNMIFKLQDKLIEKEYLAAKMYFDLGNYFGNCTSGGSNYQACIITSENALKDYPFAKNREDFSIMVLRAKFLLAQQSVESKKDERYHAAIDEYYGFTNEYPESKYLKEAKEMYQKAEKRVSKDTEITK